MEKMLCLRDAPAWKGALAQWFHEKWSVPLEAYQQSMEDSLREGTIVPSWYFCADGARIVGGCGVIENDREQIRAKRLPTPDNILTLVRFLAAPAKGGYNVR